MLDDGTYDVFVVDVNDAGDGSDAKRVLTLTFVTGEHKGEILELGAIGLKGEMWELIGMPATLTVTGGEPVVRIDRS